MPETFAYKSAPDFLGFCGERFIDHLEEGLQRYPDSRPSHLCVRSADKRDYRLLKKYAAALGQLKPDKERDLVWVSLKQPLRHLDFQLSWLELTAPKKDKDYLTGPQMLVFAQENFNGKMEAASRFDPDFILRCQSLSAEQILGV